MSKRSVFTTITALPMGMSRDVVIEFLHNHLEMIDLNPLVKERHPIKPPSHATPEEFHCTWYSLTDKISYLPGGLATGDVTYTCAFHDLPNGLQTHCYAPLGLEIRDKWTVCGSLPGEPVEPVELGIGAPVTGLYLREDVDMKCNFLATSFVKKTLKNSHGALVERLKIKAQIASAAAQNESLRTSASASPAPSSRPFTPASSGTASPPPQAGRMHSSSVGSGPYAPPPSSSPPYYTPPQYAPLPYQQLWQAPNIQPYQPYPHMPLPPPPPPPPPPPQQQHGSPYSSVSQSSPAPSYHSTPPNSGPSPSRQQQEEQQQQQQQQPPPPDSAYPDSAYPNSAYPDPLRVQRARMGSIRDVHGRVSWTTLRPQPSVHHHGHGRSQSAGHHPHPHPHPDYPAMNPYSASNITPTEGKYAGQVVFPPPVSELAGPGGDGQNSEPLFKVPVKPYMQQPRPGEKRNGACLNGPFVAELE